MKRRARKERREEAAKRGHVLLLACSVGARMARSDLEIFLIHKLLAYDFKGTKVPFYLKKIDFLKILEWPNPLSHYFTDYISIKC